MRQRQLKIELAEYGLRGSVRFIALSQIVERVRCGPGKLFPDTVAPLQ
jgi:hypothetical protein